jgi:hypothetical protein
MIKGGHWLKELNPRRGVYVEIPKPSRVELKCSHVFRVIGNKNSGKTLILKKMGF